MQFESDSLELAKIKAILIAETNNGHKLSRFYKGISWRSNIKTACCKLCNMVASVKAISNSHKYIASGDALEHKCVN